MTPTPSELSPGEVQVKNFRREQTPEVIKVKGVSCHRTTKARSPHVINPPAQSTLTLSNQVLHKKEFVVHVVINEASSYLELHSSKSLKGTPMAVGGLMSPGGNPMMSPPHSSGNMSPRPGSNDGFGMGPRPPMSPRGPSPGTAW